MSLNYTEVNGKYSQPRLTLYSLSYCESCKTAKELLDKRELSYRILLVDTLPRKQIIEVKRRIGQENGRSVLYPVLQIDEEECVYGFNAVVWSRKLDALIPAAAG